MKATKGKKAMKITDKERMEWLTRKETAFYKTVDGVQFEQSGFRCGTLRKAIDSAMKADKPGRGVR